MILDLTDQEQTFLVDVLYETADVFGDEGDDFERIAELVEAEMNLSSEVLNLIDDALNAYRDRHLEFELYAFDGELYEAVADKVGAALSE